MIIYIYDIEWAQIDKVVFKLREMYKAINLDIKDLVYDSTYTTDELFNIMFDTSSKQLVRCATNTVEVNCYCVRANYFLSSKYTFPQESGNIKEPSVKNEDSSEFLSSYSLLEKEFRLISGNSSVKIVNIKSIEEFENVIRILLKIFNDNLYWVESKVKVSVSGDMLGSILRFNESTNVQIVSGGSLMSIAVCKHSSSYYSIYPDLFPFINSDAVCGKNNKCFDASEIINRCRRDTLVEKIAKKLSDNKTTECSLYKILEMLGWY